MVRCRGFLAYARGIRTPVSPDALPVAWPGGETCFMGIIAQVFYKCNPPNGLINGAIRGEFAGEPGEVTGC